MKILTVNLNREEFSYTEGDGLRRDCIGGVALNSALLYRHTQRRIDPFDEGNHLFISPGALVGTNIPAASRCEATALSPTGYFGTASSGGALGVAIRFCGIDTLWLQGKAARPVYLVIDEHGVVIRDGRDLWGRDTFETVDILKEREGRDTEVASIGTAGERRVRFASIQNGYYHSFGRTGLGAVMGSKMVKALCFKGRAGFEVKDRRRFIKAMGKIRERIMASDAFGYTRRYGSMVVSDVYNKIGILPGLNFRRGSFDNWESTRGRRAFEERYKVKDFACVSCPIGCLHWSRVKEGRFAGLETHGLEVTFVLEIGAKLGIEDIPEIFACIELCNRLGTDVISMSSVVAYALELFEKGLLTESDIGFPPKFGDFESIYRLMAMIGRREGMGDLLGEGLRAAKAHFAGSEGFACEIKGLEMPVRDPRGRFDTWMLGYLINTRGGDHLRIRTPVDDLRDFERDYGYEPLSLNPTQLHLVDMPQRIKDQVLGNPPSRTHVPGMAKYSEELMVLLNAMGLCIRPPILRTIGPSLMAEAFNAVYGCRMDEDSLLAAAEKTVNLEHIFNLEQGLSFTEYRFPERFYTEAVDYVGGTRLPLDRDAVEKIVKDYFFLRGWDEEGRVPKKTLERLGIEPWKNRQPS